MLHMENWCHSKPMVRRRKPSFSSSLLDHICRSIDHQTTDAAAAVEENLYDIGEKTDQNMDIFMKPTNEVYGRKKSVSADYYFPQSFGLNSCSTSSDSSLWTSSDSNTSKSFGQSKTPAQTSFYSREHQQEDKKFYLSQKKLKNECGGFVKAKSKTLKVYDNLKKSNAKQPISPGSRLAAFLNSLFTSTGKAKKAKIIETNYKSANIEPSASSFSRSCLTETPSSQGKSRHGAKRSVRFYPVISVIMDEECQPDKYTHNEHCHYDNQRARNSICGEEIRENNRRARELLKNYQKRIEECKMMDDNDNDDDDDDCESCASSDLFELDFIGSKQRYREELPVYETTSIDANRAIAHGLLL